MKVNSKNVAGLPSLENLIGEGIIKEVKSSIEDTQKADFFIHNMFDYHLKLDNGDGSYVQPRYVVISFGNLIHGIPVCVIFKNVEVPIYVSLKDRDMLKLLEMVDYIIDPDHKNRYKYVRRFKHQVVSKKISTGFQEEDSKFLELTFTTNFDRSKVLKEFEASMDVFENDKSKLYRNAWARYSLNSCGWLILNNCQICPSWRHGGINNGLVLEVDIKDVINGNFTDNLHMGHRQIKLSWDIETKSYGKLSPNIDPSRVKEDPEIGYDKIEMITMCFKWTNGDPLFYKNGIPAYFCLSTHDMDTPKKYIALICKDQEDLIKCMFKLINLYKPCALMDFNGTKFDWEMVLHRMDYYKIHNTLYRESLNGDIQVNSFVCENGSTTVKIKLGADTYFEGRCFNFLFGMSLDLLPYLKKEFEYLSGDKANISSLNDFLIDNGLKQKKDMPYEVMWQIFDEGDPSKILKVANYAMRDSTALHDLDEKRFIISTIQEIGNITFTNFATGVFNANGVKIINAVRNEAFNCNKLMHKSDIYMPDTRPFGGLVLKPNKGLHAYNIFDLEKYSPDLQREVKNKDLSFREKSRLANGDYVEELQSPLLRDKLIQFYTTHKSCKDPKIVGERWIADRPSFAIDIKSSYPNNIRAENLSTDMKVKSKEEAEYLISKGYKLSMHTFAGETAWLVQHEGDINKMGIIPKMLSRLFEARVLVKKEAFKYKQQGNHFMASLFTCKEKAIKLILNSTYGLFLDKNNKYFRDDFLGQGTCNLGRYCLLIIKMMLEHLGCTVNYGDTDSNYASPPNSVFADLDSKYEKGVISIEQYKKEMVNVTISYAKGMCKTINDVFKELTMFIEVEFEEVLFQPVFILPKMYWGLVCMNKFPDTYNVEDDTLQRGIVTRKRDKSKFIKTCFYDVMRRCLDFNLCESLTDICVNQLKNLESGNYDTKLFAQMASYKEGKKNVKINTFVYRMKREFGVDILNLQKFPFYVIDKGYYSDGRVISSVGEKMMLVSVYDEMEVKPPLDKVYYAKSYAKSLSGILLYRNDIRTKDMSERYLMNFVAKPNKEKSEIIKAEFKKMKDPKYHIGSLKTNMRALYACDIMTAIFEKVVNSVNKEIYGTVKWGITFDKGFNFSVETFIKPTENLSKMIDLAISNMKCRGAVYTSSISRYINKEISSLHTKISNLVSIINSNKDEYLAIVKSYENSLTKKEKLPDKDLTSLNAILTELESHLKSYVVYNYLKTRYRC